MSKYGPAIDSSFSNVSFSGGYWSSSSYASNSDAAWGVNLYDGGDYAYVKTDSYYVRCVRDGQFGNFDTLLFKNAPTEASKISIDFDADKGIVTQNPIGTIFADGSTLTLTAIPLEGYKFSSRFLGQCEIES